MDVSPTALIKLLLPLTPLVLKTIILNILSLSKNCKYQDVRTEVTVTAIRKVVSVSSPMSRSQKISCRDPGIKGRLWVSKVTIPAPPETDAIDLIISAIKSVGDGSESLDTPSIAPVEAEWTGTRPGVAASEPRPSLPESEQYTSLMKEVTSDVTILYFHGGAYFLMDPATHRNTTSYLAKLTKGRCLSVRYRLAPQSPFPAQLLDAFISYLYLLSPPPDSFHEPVPASNIVFAGDSAGGNLAFALSLLINTLINSGKSTVNFHGRTVTLARPAGVAGNSPWLDISMSTPSINGYAHYDYLDPPDNAPPVPADDIWPTSPPRAEPFCNASVLLNPLVSPMAAKSDLWKNHPPVWMVTGFEMLTDSNLISTQRIAASGTYTELVGYEGMPHCFAMVFPTSPAGKDCYQRWATFCSDAVGGKLKQGPKKASWAKAKSNPLHFEEVAVEKLTELTEEEVDRALEEAKAKATKKEAKAIEEWKAKGQSTTAKSVSMSEASTADVSAAVASRAKL
jgi:acetyl esterase/lipase